MSLFDCCVFFYVTLTPYRCPSSAKKAWWYAFTGAKAGGDSNAGRDGEATGASSAVFCSSFFTPLWVATATRDETGGNWCVFCYFLVLLSLVASFLLLALLLLLQAGRGEVGRDLCGRRKQRGTGQGATGACVFCFSFELSFHSSSFLIISLFSVKGVQQQAGRYGT